MDNKNFIDGLWDITKLSAYLSVPTGTVRDWVYKRSIPFLKVGRLVRFKPKDIEAWLESNRVEQYNKPRW